MVQRQLVFVLLACLSVFVNCQEITKDKVEETAVVRKEGFNSTNSHNTSDAIVKDDASAAGTARRARAMTPTFTRLTSCALAKDVKCFLDAADTMVIEQTHEILAEADKDALRETGRADEESVPSSLVDVIGNLFGELTNLFSDGLSGLFRTGKEGDEDISQEDVKEVAERVSELQGNDDDDDKDDDEEEKVKDPATSRRVKETGRKKKKKKKLIAIIKALVIGAVIKAKLTLLLKLLAFKLQIKFFLVALAGLILNAARFYLDLKRGHQPQKVIYYEHAQHQHHYEGGEDDWHTSPGESGGYWGRQYDEAEDGSHAHDLAYKKQKPSSSWWD